MTKHNIREQAIYEVSNRFYGNVCNQARSKIYDHVTMEVYHHVVVAIHTSIRKSLNQISDPIKNQYFL